MKFENGTLTLSKLDRAPLSGEIVPGSWLGLHHLPWPLMDSSQFSAARPRATAVKWA
jgi:hypothetical protein